jgi:hypothetical protein
MTQNAAGDIVAQYSDYEPNLVELYTRFRYNELTCHKLMGRATTLEKAVRWSVLVLLGISLFTGLYPGLNSPALNRIWGTVTAAATLLTVYSLFEGSGEKQFHWFRLAARFRSSANEVEFFSFYVKRGKILEGELEERWKAFRNDLDRLIEHAGLGLTEYESKHRQLLTIEIRETLKQEKR